MRKLDSELTKVEKNRFFSIGVLVKDTVSAKDCTKKTSVNTGGNQA